MLGTSPDVRRRVKYPGSAVATAGGVCASISALRHGSVVLGGPKVELRAIAALAPGASHRGEALHLRGPAVGVRVDGDHVPLGGAVGLGRAVEHVEQHELAVPLRPELAVAQANQRVIGLALVSKAKIAIAQVALVAVALDHDAADLGIRLL